MSKSKNRTKKTKFSRGALLLSGRKETKIILGGNNNTHKHIYFFIKKKSKINWFLDFPGWITSSLIKKLISRKVKKQNNNDSLSKDLLIELNDKLKNHLFSALREFDWFNKDKHNHYLSHTITF